MPKLNALVAGSTGYIGVQLIKLLIKHKYINIKYLCGNSSVGKNISNYDKSLSRKKLPKIIRFNKKLLKDVDVVFTALPNGEAQDISKYLTKNITLIDLAADFRLAKGSDYLKWYKQKHKAKNLIKAAKKYEKKGKIEKAQKRYAKAQKLLLKSNDKKPLQADTLNYLGFTNYFALLPLDCVAAAQITRPNAILFKKSAKL